MKLDFTDDGNEGAVTIEMVKYIKTVLSEMPEEMKGKAATPAANHLFQVREDPVFLEQEKADSFHKIVMQLQYLSQRA